MEEKNVYLIYNDSMDDACEIRGYIYGTESDAEKYCEECNKDCKYEYEEMCYIILERLN